MIEQPAWIAGSQLAKTLECDLNVVTAVILSAGFVVIAREDVARDGTNYPAAALILQSHEYGFGFFSLTDHNLLRPAP